MFQVPRATSCSGFPIVGRGRPRRALWKAHLQDIDVRARCIVSVRCALALWAVVLVTLLSMGPAGTAQAATEHVPALPQAEQPAQGVTRQLYVLPAESTTVRLQTHVANLSVIDAADGGVSVYLDAAYALSNPGTETVALPLLLFLGTGRAAPQDVSLMVDNQVVGLTPRDDGYAAQVEVDADARLTLRLRYRVQLDDAPLATVRYAPSILRRWPGGVSLRVEVALPISIARESWTMVTPDTWSYAASGAEVTAVKWLYDAGMPEEPFVVQFVKPAVFAQIQAAETASAANGPAGSFLALGDLYRALSEAEAAPAPVRARFLAQAIAAYADGAARQSTATGDELARMHVGLAGIYRGRTVTAEAGAEQYAAAMVEEAALALALLPAEDSRRGELMQWRADGLRLALEQALAGGDWSRAGRLVEELAALPAGIVDAEMLAQQRRTLLVEQALQLLARGERNAAIALAGPEIVGNVAMPPVELQPIFASWQITATVKAEIVEIDAVGQPYPERADEARQTLSDVSALWRSAADGRGPSGVTADLAQAEQTGGPIRLRVELPQAADGAAPATYLPVVADWALLRAVLAQVDPQVEKTSRLFWQDVRVSQPLDLRSAGEQWNAMAVNLDRQAAELTAQVEGDAEAALRRQIQAVNYRNVAESWRGLARDSWLLYQFAGEQSAGAPAGEARSWYATVKSPPLVFSVQAQTVNANLLAGFGVLVAVFVAGLSGLLWWLM